MFREVESGSTGSEEVPVKSDSLVGWESSGSVSSHHLDVEGWSGFAKGLFGNRS